jgi:hypothetical protein
MGAGYMRRRRGSILPFLLVTSAKGFFFSILCDKRGCGRGDISFQLISRFLILFTMIYSILADSLELDTSPQCRYRKT